MFLFILRLYQAKPVNSAATVFSQGSLAYKLAHYLFNVLHRDESSRVIILKVGGYNML